MRKHILILGAGFGGLETTTRLMKKLPKFKKTNKLEDKMRKKKILIWEILVVSFVLSCETPFTEEKEEMEEEKIQNCDIIEIIQQNAISDECREEIQDVLPARENNLINNVIALGQGKIDENLVLFLTGSDSLGKPILLPPPEFTIKVEHNGTFTTLDTSEYQLKTLKDFSGILISMSSIIDYSSSMRNQDIDDAVEIYTDIFNVFQPVFESEIRIFSGLVLRKIEFTSDQGTLLAQITRDNDFPRTSTALYDAIGEGLTALSKQNGLIKLLVVATDGLENTSTTFTSKSQLYNLSKQHNIPVIILGSLLANIFFMEEIAEETNGFYIYSQTFLELKYESLLLIQLLSNIQVIEIKGTSWTQATAFDVSINNKTITFTF